MATVNCKHLKMDLQEKTLEDLVGKQYHGEWVVDWTTKPGAMVEKVYTHYSYSYATQVVILDENTGIIKKIIAMRKLEPAKLDEIEFLIDSYKEALGMNN